MSNPLGTLPLTAKTNTIFQSAVTSGIKAVRISNLSPFTCTISMIGGGVSKYLFAGTLDWFDANPGWTGNIQCIAAQAFTNVKSFPVNQLQFDTISINDSDGPQNYPLALPLVVVGSSINILDASTLTNVGNPPGTQVVFLQPSGDTDPLGAVNITNDASVSFGDDQTSGAFSVNSSIASGNPDIGMIAGNLIITGAANSIQFQLGRVDVSAGGSGTCTAYQWMQGNGAQMTVVVMNNFKAGGAARSITLPNPHAVGAMIRTGGIGTSGNGGLQLLSGGSGGTPQVINITISLAAAGGGIAPGSPTVIYANSFGECISPFDTLSFPLNNGGAHTGFILIEGQ